jgi:hypothetical protein
MTSRSSTTPRRRRSIRCARACSPSSPRPRPRPPRSSRSARRRAPKVDYHLLLLESHGLAQEAQTRMHGGLTERRLVASAQSFVASPPRPARPAPVPAIPPAPRDRLSARYLVALVARLIDELSTLARDEDSARLSTLSVDTRSPSSRARRVRRVRRRPAAAVTQLVEVPRSRRPAAPARRRDAPSSPTTRGGGPSMTARHHRPDVRRTSSR